MAKIYTKGTTVVDEVLSGAERYDIKENAGTAFKSNMQIVLATSITTPGTAINAARLNNIETGIDTLDTKVADANDLLTTGGTTTAYTLTTTGAAALATGERFRVKFNATAGATPTLNRDSKGAKSLKYYDSAGTKQACTSSNIVANLITNVVYDGTDYVVMDPAGVGITDHGALTGLSDDDHPQYMKNEGWISVSATWTRTGNYTFTVSGDVTATYRKGTKVRYKDGGSYEYGYVQSSSYSAPNTTVTLFTNTDYAMAATTITDTAISYIENPEGFPDWFNRTPTLTASGSMTITASTLTFARFKVRARSVLENISYSAITLGGTASTDIRVSTVVAPANDLVVFTANVASNGGTQEISTGLIIQSGPYFRCRRNAAANYVVGAGAQCYVNAEYEF